MASQHYGVPRSDVVPSAPRPDLYYPAVQAVPEPKVIEIGQVFETDTAHAATVVGPFDPASLSGLSLWLKADDMGTFADGDPVGTWPDRAAGGFDVSATTTARPTYKTNILNGLPVVRFNGTSNVMNGTDLNTVLDTSPNMEYTVIALAKTVSAPAAGANSWLDPAIFTDGNGSMGMLTAESGGVFRYWAYNFDTGDDFTSVAGTYGDWTIISQDHAVTGPLRLKLDGGTFSTQASGATDNCGTTQIGANYTEVSFFNGDIAEIVLYDRVLTDTERDQVEAYLTEKWIAAPAPKVIEIGQVAEKDDAETAPLQLALPFYIYPSWLGSSWQTITAEPRNISLVVMNDASGHAAAINSDYTVAVDAARAAGHTIIAYIETSYGAEPEATVKQEMANFRDWYDVDGFFFDEVASDAPNLAYYLDLRAWVDANMAAGKRLIALNHGTNPVEGYVDAGDILITFEGSASSYSSWTGDAWQSSYSKTRFWHLVYDEPTLATSLALARSRHVAHIYITDSTLAANPWDELPTYWTTEQSSVDDSVYPGQTTVVKGHTIGQVSESSSSLDPSSAKAKAIGQPAETDTALDPTVEKQRTIGQPAETDTSQSFTVFTASGTGQVEEADTAQPVTKRIARTLVQPGETDTAHPMTPRRTYSIGQVNETTLSQTTPPERTYHITQVTVTDTARGFGAQGIYLIGQVTEADEAIPFSKIDHIVGLIGQVQETDTAIPLYRPAAKSGPTMATIPTIPTIGTSS